MIGLSRQEMMILLFILARLSREGEFFSPNTVGPTSPRSSWFPGK